VCHDGIQTQNLQADPEATTYLKRIDRNLNREEDEVFTFMARNMEPTRGFHQFMRALPRILDARPNARVILIGGSDYSYGRASDKKGGYREEMENEVGHLLDWDRVHFVGKVPYNNFQRIVQVSRCHIYMTVPFVLSWSFLESMAMEATVVASDTSPVKEVVEHGKNGLLVDFFDPKAIANQVIEVLENPKDFAHLGPAARQTVVEKYDYNTVCLPEHIRQLNSLVSPDKALPIPGE
ncbi:MAG: glycosyltransferase, partial [Verrucomicrobiota bacterium]